MEMADNPKLVMEESTGPEKTSLSDTLNRFQYSTTAKKSDSFVVDMETFNDGAKDINANSRITRNHSKKGIQRGEKKTNSNSNYANDTIIASSPRVGSSMPEKPTVVAAGTTDYSINPQVHHQITVTTGNIITNTPDSSRFAIKRNSFKRSSSLWVLDPKRVLLFFATLSSLGTMLLIYFTLTMSKHNADEITLD